MSSKLKDNIVRLLTRREYSAHELRVKMEEKNWPTEAIDHELEVLRSEGLQSDLRFCEALCRHYSFAGKGPLLVLHELINRGVCQNLAQEVIDQFCWQESFELACRKLRAVSGTVLSKRLYARGFSPDAMARHDLHPKE